MKNLIYLLLALLLLTSCTNMTETVNSNKDFTYEDFQNINEQIKTAKDNKDVDKTLELYKELYNKIDNLKLTEQEKQRYPINETEFIKDYKPKLKEIIEYYEDIPNKFASEVTRIQTNISNSKTNLERAYYQIQLAYTYELTKDYDLIERTLNNALTSALQGTNEVYQTPTSNFVTDDGEVLTSTPTEYNQEEMLTRVYKGFWSLYELKGNKQEKINELKVKLENDTNDFQTFLFLEASFSIRNKEGLLEFYKSIDNLNSKDLSYQNKLDQRLNTYYSETKNYEEKRELLEEDNEIPKTVYDASMIAITYIKEGKPDQAIEYIEKYFPGYGEDISWYKALTYRSAMKETYGDNKEIYLQKSNQYFEDNKKYQYVDSDSMDYHIAENYFWYGNKQKATELFDEIIRTSDNAQMVANANNFKSDYRLNSQRHK